MIKPSICLTVIVLLISSCKKYYRNKTDATKYWDCHQSQNLDSAGVDAKLIGYWKLIAYSNVGEAKKSDKKVILAIKSDHTFDGMENSQVTVAGKWTLKRIDRSFHFEMDPPSVYLYGNILFCDNKVLFNNSYIDGSDHLFKKK